MGVIGCRISLPVHTGRVLAGCNAGTTAIETRDSDVIHHRTSYTIHIPVLPPGNPDILVAPHLFLVTVHS